MSHYTVEESSGGRDKLILQSIGPERISHVGLKDKNIWMNILESDASSKIE